MMQTQSRKAKGRRLQNWVVDKLKAYFNYADGDIRSAIMGETGSDIKLTPEALQTFNFDIECKNQEGFNNVYKAFEQSRLRTYNSTKEALLILKMNNRKPLAVLDANLFFKFASRKLSTIKDD